MAASRNDIRPDAANPPTGRTGTARFGNWRLPTAILALTLTLYATLAVLEAAPWEFRIARGDAWEALGADGNVLRLAPDSKGINLRAEERLRLRDPESPERRLTSVRFAVERLSEVTFLDLRFGVTPDSAYELKLARRSSFGVTLLRVPRDAPRAVLATANETDHLPKQLVPFEVELAFVDGRIRVAIDHEQVLDVPDDPNRDGSVELIARANAARVLGLSARGTAGGEPFEFEDTFRELGGGSLAGIALGAILRGIAAFLCGFLWLGFTQNESRSWRAVFRTAALASAPIAILCAVAAATGIEVGESAFLVAGMAGAIPAWIGLRRRPVESPDRVPGSRARHRLGLLVLVVLLAVIGFRGAERELSLHAAARERVAATITLPPAAAFARAAETTLDAGNVIAVESPFRDLDLDASIRLGPNAILEVRLHGERADGVELLLSADHRIPTRFVRATPIEFATIGSGSIAQSGSTEAKLAIRIRGESYVATLDGREIANCVERLYPAGSVSLLASRGTVAVRELAIRPVVAAARDTGARTDALLGALRAVGTLVLYAVLAALLLRRSLSGVLLGASFSGLVFVITVASAGAAEASRALAIVAPAACALLLVFDAARDLQTASPLRFHAVVLLAIGVGALIFREARRREWPPDEAQVNALSILDGPESRIEPDLVDFEHPLLRRWNYYLIDHRFRKRAFQVAKTPGTSRILALGSSSTYGYGAGEDWPTLLETELRSPALGSRRIEVLNAAYPGTTSWRLYEFFQNVLLAFDPDVLVLCLYYNDAAGLTQFDERQALRRITSPAGRSMVEDLITRRAIDVGAPRFEALDRRFRDEGGDALALWPADAETPPPERFRAILRDFAILCRERGIGLVFVQEPISGDRRRLWKDEFRAVIRSIGEEFGTPIVDPTAAQVGGGGERLFMDEVHPYVEGHRITARLLAPVMAHVLDERGGR